jgi:hypothetical protein
VESPKCAVIASRPRRRIEGRSLRASRSVHEIEKCGIELGVVRDHHGVAQKAPEVREHLLDCGGVAHHFIADRGHRADKPGDPGQRTNQALVSFLDARPRHPAGANFDYAPGPRRAAGGLQIDHNVTRFMSRDPQGGSLAAGPSLMLRVVAQRRIAAEQLMDDTLAQVGVGAKSGEDRPHQFRSRHPLGTAFQKRMKLFPDCHAHHPTAT